LIMNRLLLVVNILVVYLVPSLQGHRTPSGKVVVLTDASFDNVTTEGTWLIDLYAPWYDHVYIYDLWCRTLAISVLLLLRRCSHCVQLEPVWRTVAKQQAAQNIHVAKVG
jgi:hypothetical protein